MYRAQHLLLTDSLRLPETVQAQARALLDVAQAQSQPLLESLWPYLDPMGVTQHQAWKALLDLAGTGQLPLPPPSLYLPDRVARCLLEGVGRLLRQHADRKRIFALLQPVLDPQTLGDESALQHAIATLAASLQAENSYEKQPYLFNVAEQMVRFYLEYDVLPDAYETMQGPPVLKTPFLTLAADDGPERGQVYRLRLADDQLYLRFKYPLTPTPQGRADWAWTEEVAIPIPPVLAARLAAGAELQAPTLRLMPKKGGGETVVLDVITANPLAETVHSGNVLAYDWGVRRLATIVVLDADGQQLTPPIFLDTGGFDGKQARLRRQIDELNAKLKRLAPDDPQQDAVKGEIAACWRKYEARNKMLAHLASTLMVCLALLYECETIAGEWLGTLRARKKQRGRGKRARFRNWRINSTVRSALSSKVAYKAKRVGIRFTTVWPRGTSHECPRCAQAGKTTRSPEHQASLKWGAWFHCPACGYNADRDYVGAVNIGRRAVWRHDDDCKPASYSGAGAARLFPSRLVRSKLFTTLSGVGNLVHFRPRFALRC